MGRKTFGLLVALLVWAAFVIPVFAVEPSVQLAMLSMAPAPSWSVHARGPSRPPHRVANTRRMHGGSSSSPRRSRQTSRHTRTGGSAASCANSRRNRSRHTTNGKSAHVQYYGPGSRHKKSRYVKQYPSKTKAPAPARLSHKFRTYMYDPPAFKQTPYSAEVCGTMHHAFNTGKAVSYDPQSLVRAGVFTYCPLHGGIFWRNQAIKFIVVHSTETGKPADAQRVIHSWNNMGLVHPGAQFVVDRDGTIYMTLDPDMGCPHVDTSRTLWGVNNDNAVGIEIDHTGDQTYTAAQKEAVMRLVSYLQDRYNVTDDHVVTHHFVQPSDRTDPVNFDWDGFLSCKGQFRSLICACKIDQAEHQLQCWASKPDSLPWSKRIPAFFNNMWHRRS